jgi:hypothetical protein
MSPKQKRIAATMSSGQPSSNTHPTFTTLISFVSLSHIFLTIHGSITSLNFAHGTNDADIDTSEQQAAFIKHPARPGLSVVSMLDGSTPTQR